MTAVASTPARAGARPARDRAGHAEPAGTGLDRRAFLLRSAGLGLAVYGAGAAAARRSRRASRPRRPPGRKDGPGERVHRRRRRLALAARAGRRPALPQAAPDARARPDRAARSPRTRGCAGIPPPRRWPSCTARARSPCCPRRLHQPDQSHFTSRHFWEVGALDPHLAHGLARPRTSTASARPTTRCRASRSTGSSRRRWRPRATRSRRSTSPTTPTSGRRGVWGEVAGPRCSSAIGALGGAPAPRRRAGSRRRPAPRASGAARRRSRRSAQGRRARRYTARVRLPGRGRRVPDAPRGLAAMLGAGLPLRASRSSAPGAYDTHDNQADVAGRRTEADVRLAAGLPARPRGARARRPRARARVVGVRPPRARRTARGTDHGAAGAGFLIGTRAAGPHGRRVPGPRAPRQGRQPARHRRLPRLYRSLFEDWFGVDAGRSCRARSPAGADARPLRSHAVAARGRRLQEGAVEEAGHASFVRLGTRRVAARVRRLGDLPDRLRRPAAAK